MDQAWGPHFGFHSALPRSAIADGADLVVTSVHKLLSALSQGALLLAQGTRVDPVHFGGECANDALDQSLAADLRLLERSCRRQMVVTGGALLDRTLELAMMRDGVCNVSPV